MENFSETFVWPTIDKFIKDNPYYLVSHHLDSYNDFVTTGISRILHENNPMRWSEIVGNRSKKDKNKEEVYASTQPKELFIYLGGKEGNQVYFGKPVIFETNPRYLYPNEARLKNLSYTSTIHVDIVVDVIYYVATEKSDVYEKKIETLEFNHEFLCKIPIMLHSKLCILHDLPQAVRYNMGECKYDFGGYFVIDGNEKVIVCQEKFSDNCLNIKKANPKSINDKKWTYKCSIRSVSEDSSKQIRTTSLWIMAPNSVYSNGQIMVDIPNVRRAIPFFVLMRALGILSDRDIIETCILDLEKYGDLMPLFIPSINDAGLYFDQESCLHFIASFTKQQTISTAKKILMDYFIPHVGESNFIDKAYNVGNYVFKMLLVVAGREEPTVVDNFKNKRFELSGALMYDLFREFYRIQQKLMLKVIDREYYYHGSLYTQDNFPNLIKNNLQLIFTNKEVKQDGLEGGLKRAFKGNWGATAHTKRLGVTQELNRLSWGTFISHLRKFVLQLDSSAKVVKPRLIDGTHWGKVDPLDSPDGANIGTHKHLSLGATVTSGVSKIPIIKWFRKYANMILLQETSPKNLSKLTKLSINGHWVGVINDPIGVIKLFNLYKLNGLIPVYVSCNFIYKKNEIEIYSDAGRMVRPIFYRDFNDGNSLSILSKQFYSQQTRVTWQQLVSGLIEKPDNFSLLSKKIYGVEYSEEELHKNKGVVCYVDASEEDSALIAMNYDLFVKNKYYTHMEIHPSLILGVMGNQIIFPEHNPYPRDVFSCGQTKQAVSISHTNQRMRMDKMSVTLYYGQVPLIKSRYLEYFNNEEMLYSVNTMVAIMSFDGYNVEDATLINKGSIERGLFNTGYNTTYEAHEVSSDVSKGKSNTFFSNLVGKNVTGLKAGYDYGHLDEFGLIKEGTIITDEIVLIGVIIASNEDRTQYVDASIFTKKGQLGIVTKSFMTEGSDGTRLAKVTIAEIRIPSYGDKFASRAGQKGTCGRIIPEEDMPYTVDGVRPDMIINPHAIPSRMTIGHLIECPYGKAGLIVGAFGECTAFTANGPNYSIYGKILQDNNFHSSGNEIMYNGYTGEQFISTIYFGPTTYMRLKHMTKDKINVRAKGAMEQLTRQPNPGRANGGGLRMGEMERDGLLGNGMIEIIDDAFMTRGDEYFLAICNKTGMIAIYNNEKNIFISPFADGPMKFSDSIDGQKVIDTVSKFSRSFSIIRIPYAFKLLMQEVQTLGVAMRIITDANIDQLQNMAYKSGTINALLGADSGDSLKTVIDEYKLKLSTKLDKNVDIAITKANEEAKEEFTIYSEPIEVAAQKIHDMYIVDPEEWALEEGPRSPSSVLGLIFIIIDEFPLVEIWEKWLETGDKTKVFIRFIAKYPERVQNQFVKDHMVTLPSLRPEWGSVEITKTMVMMLQELYNVDELNIDRFAFASESCIPLFGLDFTLDKIYKTNLSWLNVSVPAKSKTTDPTYYKQLKPLSVLIPAKHIRKADQWCLLTRKDVKRVLEYPTISKIDTLGLFSSPEINASDELYIPTVLNLFNLMLPVHGPKFINKQLTFSSWEKNSPHPKTFADISSIYNQAVTAGNNVEFGDNSLFARKFKYYPEILRDWEAMVNNTGVVSQVSSEVSTMSSIGSTDTPETVQLKRDITEFKMSKNPRENVMTKYFDEHPEFVKPIKTDTRVNGWTKVMLPNNEFYWWHEKTNKTSKKNVHAPMEIVDIPEPLENIEEEGSEKKDSSEESTKKLQLT